MRPPAQRPSAIRPHRFPPARRGVPACLTMLAPLAIAGLAFACAGGGASTAATPAPAGAAAGVAPAADAIQEATLKQDLYYLASDAMRGREAGTLDELRAAAWEAKRAREAGLQPAGDDGTYFQFWPMRRVRVSAESRVALDGTPLALGTDAVLVTPVEARVDAPVVFAGEGRAADLAAQDVRGKAVVELIHAPATLPPAGMSLWGWRYSFAALRQGRDAIAAGAAAVILVSDSVTDANFGVVASGLARGRYNIDTTGAGDIPAQAPVIWVPRAMLDRVRSAKRLTAAIESESFLYPSVNVVARVPGTDPALRDQYVLFSSHTDHDGVRYPVHGDSIWNGADDNASTSVAILAIGRAFARTPAKRSALFVWHGAEERGLLGSRWFVDHPTVPREAIVAVINGDLIGRNGPDSAALLGVTSPHRNSVELVQAALTANARLAHFTIDSSWDSPSHAEFWYYRSDHLPYARAGIPSIMFSTLLHPDYHTPRDEADRIDYAKLTRMARWMYATGWIVANAPTRPSVDPGFRLAR